MLSHQVAPLVVGFDLDMTLIDTVPGFSATLRAVAAEHGVEIDVDSIADRLGPPLVQLLAGHLPAEQIDDAVRRFRELYRDLAIEPVSALAGAVEAMAAVRRHGGSVVVVTGKFAANAALHLEHLALDHDHLVGDLWGAGKGAALTEHGVSVYVGDHVHDVEGALAGGALSVSVLTGGCRREELLAAGTHVVLDDLTGFPAWLDEHLLTTRLAALHADLEARGSLLVAYSGGADSAFLLAAAVRALGADRVAAATGYSHSLPGSERDPAAAFATSLGVPLLTPATHEMEREGYRANSGQRCYFCKAELVEVLEALATERGLAHVATGTNADDVRAGFRPGIRAAAERGAITPLADAGLTKEQVREASRRWGLPTWDKPAAACLSSRIAYGIEVSPHRLARVERAEADVRRVLAEAGVPLRDLRVRDLGDRASVEVDAALLAGPLAPGGDLEQQVRASVVAAGFDRAEVDPRGFRSGSMNERLPT